MKKICLLFLSFWAYNLAAQCPVNETILSEGFETATAANPPSGWLFNGVDTDQLTATPARTGTQRIGLNATGEYAIVKRLFCPGPMNFYWRSSGASNVYNVSIDYSYDKVAWTNVGSIAATGSGAPTTYQLKAVTMPNASFIAPFNIYVRYYMTTRTSGTFLMDDLSICKGTCTVTPTQLRFFDVPTNCISINKAFALKVCATDNNGYIDSTYASNISVNLAAGTGVLSGTNPVLAIKGCANFADLKYSTIAPLTLAASSGALMSTNNPMALDIVTKCPNVDTLKLVTYNVLNFPEGGVYALGSNCTPALTNINRADTLGKIMTYLKPDILIVQELQTEAGANQILNKGLNIGGVSHYAMAPYIPNTSTANVTYNNELYYNSTKWALKTVRIIKTGTRDCTYYIMYGKDPNLATTHDTTFIDVLSFHTKARGFIDPDGDNERKRADCQAVIDSVRKWYPGSRNIVIGGDLNFYSKTDGGFLALTTGANKFNDPVPEIVGGDGNWESNIAYAPLHTQAARCQACLSLECGATGGLDSRLDFWLMSDAVIAGSLRAKYIDNSHNILGNDGTKFNKSVNLFTGPNGRVAAEPAQTNAVPQAILNSLFNMSDHLPLEVKIKITYPDIDALAINDLKLFTYWHGKNAIISWEAADYYKAQSIELQHSTTGASGSFKTIFQSNEPSLFTQFIDSKIKPGINYYRLIVVDLDGDINTSKIVKLVFDKLSYVSVFPNPVVNELNINTYHLEAESDGVQIFDIKGKLIDNFELNGEGFITKKYPTNQLAKGIYFVVISTENEKNVYKILKE